MTDATSGPRFADVTLTYLQMHARPAQRRVLPADASVRRLDSPTAEVYRELYNGVGGQWHWADRRLIGDEELLREITHPRVDILVLEVGGETAGYAELDRRRWPDLQLAYFGLMPGFIGRGLGGAFLDSVLSHAWDLSPARVWLHTCSLDHPTALPMYRSAGFSEYKTEMKRQRLLDSEIEE